MSKMKKPLHEIIDEVYIDRCAGCNHWREYDHIGAIGNSLQIILYRCPECKLVIGLTETELREKKDENT